MRLFAVAAVALVLVLGIAAAWLAESRMSEEVENAGMRMTSYTDEDNAAQVFMNDRWYRKADTETLLVIGIDEFGSITGSDSYNNDNQADFLILFIRDTKTGESEAIHINRDTIADITVLGVTGQAAGTRRAQLALAYNYGSGENDSSRNTAEAVSRLLYGMEIDHYITVTMDAVAVLNDWVGGVELEIMEDFTGINDELIKGETVRLTGDQATQYVRTRKGLDDSSNLSRMQRQRQYANAWFDQARSMLESKDDIMQLIMAMSDYHYSDCTAEELVGCAEWLNEADAIEIHEIEGESVKGDQFMEYYVDEEKLQQLVLDVFYDAVE